MVGILHVVTRVAIQKDRFWSDSCFSSGI